MRTLIVVMFLLAGSSCATTHDWCLQRLDHYSSYDECYKERSQAKVNAQKAWKDAMTWPPKRNTDD